MILFGVSCIATPFVDAHPEHVRMLRCRADSVLRFWQGDQEYLQGSNEAARSLPGYYAHEFSPRTRREDVSLFVWDCFQDIWAPFFDINGYPTSFYDLKAEDRARLTQFPPLPLEALRALWLKVDALLTEQGIRKGLIFVQPDRLAATSPELAELLARWERDRQAESACSCSSKSGCRVRRSQAA